MRKTLFTIDGIEAVFEGYTDGSHWNGWAKPWFTKEIAEEIMRINNAYYTFGEWQMRYDAEQDAFIREYEDEEPDVFQGKDINGLHLYPIGNAYWVWDDLAEYQSEQTKKLMKYLREEYFYLNCEQLYDVYYGIAQEIDDYMTDDEVKIFADGFMAAYDRRKSK